MADILETPCFLQLNIIFHVVYIYCWKLEISYGCMSYLCKYTYIPNPPTYTCIFKEYTCVYTLDDAYLHIWMHAYMYRRNVNMLLENFTSHIISPIEKFERLNETDWNL